MFEEDSLLDEQIRKKKRFVLLALFTLFLIGTFAALSLIGPTAPSLQTVAELEQTPTPGQLTFTPSNETTITSGPTSRANATIETTAHPAATVSAGATTPSAMAEATSAGSEIPATAEASPDAIQGDEWQEPGTTPGSSANDTPIGTLTVESKPELGESSPSSTPELAGTSETGTLVTTTSGEGASASTVATEESLDINELPRVHESWSPTGTDKALSTPEASATTPVVPTIGLTHTSALSETELVAPPDGLPVTGISLSNYRFNWAAVVIVILLLGAGITALCHPGPGRR